MIRLGILLFFIYFNRLILGICDVTDDITSCYNKFLSFEAIGDIHKYLDGDKNGEVDSSEAAKFVRDEFSPAERAQQPRSLPQEDPYISLTDLWTMWQRNTAFNWTVKQTIHWLIDYVNLPQYEEIFAKHSVNGKALPLLAMSNASFLTDVLLIRNPIHKKKLMVKALDTILFGPPRKRPLLTTETSLITASFSLLTIVLMGLFHWIYCAYFSKANPASSTHDLSAADSALKDLQSRLDDLERLRFALNSCELDERNAQNTLSTNSILAEKRRSSDALGNNNTSSGLELKRQPGSVLNDWLASTTAPNGLETAAYGNNHLSPPSEDRIEWDGELGDSINWLPRGESARTLVDWDTQQSSRWSAFGPETACASSELALWLQLTYELEMQHYMAKKADAEQHLNSIRQACKRLHRKRYTILGSVRLIHSDSLDDLEHRLVRAKLVLEQLQNEMHQRRTRWTRIETLLGLKLRCNHNPGRIQQLLATKFGSVLSVPTESAARVTTNPEYDFEPREVGGLANAYVEIDNTPETDADAQAWHQAKHRDANRAPIRPTSGRTQLPRNYSFVRPFAALWRRKAGSRLAVSSKAVQ